MQAVEPLSELVSLLFLGRLRKATKLLSRNSRCSGRDSKRESPEYKSEESLLEATCWANTLAMWPIVCCRIIVHITKNTGKGVLHNEVHKIATSVF
jgi:hypothetical protein